jgi:hypothetical protein
MKAINPIEQEINRIRLEIYEETKNLTKEQRIEHTNKIAETAAKEFRLIRIASAKDDTRLQG